MSSEIIKADATQAVTPQAQSMVTLAPIAADALVARMRAVEDVIARLFTYETHFGPVPGTDGQLMLLKPGMELLAACFSLALSYEVQQGDLPFGDVRFVVTCNVTNQQNGAFLGSGVGEASTVETKFAWRSAGDKEWDATAEDRRRIKRGRRRDGNEYAAKQVREEASDKFNTCLKMATKRAADDAIQAVLGVRGLIEMRLDDQAQKQGVSRGCQAAAPKPQPVPADWLNVLRETAKRKGIREPDLLAEVKRASGVSLKSLDQVTAADYGFLSAELGKLPDVDDVTGEVAGAEAAS